MRGEFAMLWDTHGSGPDARCLRDNKYRRVRELYGCDRRHEGLSYDDRRSLMEVCGSMTGNPGMATAGAGERAGRNDRGIAAQTDDLTRRPKRAS